MDSAGGTARARRRLPAPGVIVLVVALIGAFLVSRGCQRSQVRLTKAQAVAVGQRHIDFKPQGHRIASIPRGIPPKRFWAVSYFIRDRTGGFKRCTQVMLSANTGKLVEGYPKSC